MIDFSTLKGLTIPEGNVKQISDAQGNVLWSAAKPVTITLSGTGKVSSCFIAHNGTRYSGTKYYDATQTPSFVANVGDTIYCFAGMGYSDSRVSLNGTKVAEGEQDDAEYYYTVVSNATIEFRVTSNYNRIYITET